MTPLIWIIAGIVLCLLEFASPAFVLIFFGTSSVATGLLLWLGLPAGNGIPFVVFALLTIVQIIVLRRRFRRAFTGKTADRGDESSYDDFLHHEAETATGFTAPTLKGRVKFRGIEWDALSDVPLQPGERVTITNRSGSVLYVQR
jgi:membrane protein implicated in regulation of membrane protease activity